MAGHDKSEVLERRCVAMATELARHLSTVNSGSLAQALREPLAACAACGAVGLYFLYDDGAGHVRFTSSIADGNDLFSGSEARVRERAATAKITHVTVGAVDAIVAPLFFAGVARAVLTITRRLHDETDRAWPAAERVQQVVARATEHGDSEASRSAGALLRALVENAPDFIIHIDRAKTIRFANKLGDARPQDVIGIHWLAFIAPEHHATAEAALDRTLATGKVTSYEIIGVGDHGPRTLYWSRIAPVYSDGQIVGAVLVARDITEQKKAETQLIAAERMASVGLLAAGVAHEINNPLAAVVANLEIVHDLCPADDVAVQAALVDARAGADRVREIVRDLRIFSRADVDKRGPVNVHDVLESTLRLAWNEVRHRAELVKEYGDIPPVTADESRLGQVFLNLVVNAAQAIPEGNASHHRIGIRTSVDERGRVAIRFSDTGPGIPHELRADLFTPFFTTKPAGVGTGLGLAICQRTVHSFGGEITVESELGRGTAFCVLLPPAPAAVAPAIADASPSVSSAQRARVLTVDDDHLVTAAIGRVLGRDHDVTTVDNAQAALDLLASGARYDVVLCDLMMPRISGMDFFRLLERDYPEQAARVVFVTGGAFTPLAREFLDGVANPRLDKPFDSLALRSLVNGFMATRAG